MLVEFLCVGEGDRTGGAGSSNVGEECASSLAAGWALPATVWRVLLDAVNSCQMPFEDISTIKTFLGCRATTRAEAAYHSALVVSKGVSVLIVLACKALDVILACCDWALFGSLVLVSEHVCLEILENTTAFWEGAHALLARLVIKLEAAVALAAGSRVVRVQ